MTTSGSSDPLMAQWLHDEVVPSLMAAGLRVELARAVCPACSPEAAAHLEQAAQILEALAHTVRDEMGRRDGRPRAETS